jgi:mgtE-like transporter
MVVTTLIGAAFLFRSKLKVSRRIVQESLPILLGAGCLSLVAGIALERSLEKFLTFTVLLVLLPGFLASSGALGGILSNRLSTKVHLGFIEPARIPTGEARADIGITYALALPIFVFLAVLAGTAGHFAGETSPGIATLVAVAVTGGLVTTTAVAAIAYYGTLAVVRFGLDPDNTGIPIVSALLDVVGALTFIGALLLWGVA